MKPADLKGLMRASLALHSLTLLLLCERTGEARAFVIRVIEAIGRQLISADGEEPDSTAASALAGHSTVISQLRAPGGPFLTLIRGGRPE